MPIPLADILHPADLVRHGVGSSAILHPVDEALALRRELNLKPYMDPVLARSKTKYVEFYGN